MKSVRLVCVTRLSPESFRKSLLGRSIQHLTILHSIFYNNQDGGPSPSYNQFLTEQYRNEYLVFLHDDVFIDDYWIDVRINEALAVYDVVGLTGLSYTLPIKDPIWDGTAPWDCGTVAQGTPENNHFWRLRNRSPYRVYALDGLCIAVNTAKILDAGIRWDPQFTRDYYDLDFCCQCNEKGLTLGVWPLALTHSGKGSGKGPQWYQLQEAFKKKWGTR